MGTTVELLKQGEYSLLVEYAGNDAMHVEILDEDGEYQSLQIPNVPALKLLEAAVILLNTVIPPGRHYDAVADDLIEIGRRIEAKLRDL